MRIEALGWTPNFAGYRPAAAASASEPEQPRETVELTRRQSLRFFAGGLATAAIATGAQALAVPSPVGAATAVKVLSLNVWLDSQGGVDGIADIIRASKADLVGLQETKENTKILAEKLGMHYLQQNDSAAILSRFPLEATTPNKHGAIVRLDNGRLLAMMNVHLNHEPYQPYQLLGIPYGDFPFIHTEAEAREQALLARGDDVRAALQDFETIRGLPTVLTADMNEPSHLDWTERAAAAGRHPIKVEWPSSRAFADAGFQDSYRVIHPDEMAHPGFTWTPTTKPDDPEDHHDRLDFVLFQGPGITPTGVAIVGENERNATIVVVPYVTDHRGSLGEFLVD
jgi:exonuclease III